MLHIKLPLKVLPYLQFHTEFLNDNKNSISKLTTKMNGDLEF